MQPRLPYGKVLTGSIVMPLAGASNEGGYARALPGRVGRHKPCVPVVEYGSIVSVWDHFAMMMAVLPRRWLLVFGVDMGPPTT